MRCYITICLDLLTSLSYDVQTIKWLRPFLGMENNFFADINWVPLSSMDCYEMHPTM